jgi:hypothetical protein
MCQLLDYLKNKSENVIFEAKFTNPELALGKYISFFGVRRAMELQFLLWNYMRIKPIVTYFLFAMINQVE